MYGPGPVDASLSSASVSYSRGAVDDDREASPHAGSTSSFQAGLASRTGSGEYEAELDDDVDAAVEAEDDAGSGEGVRGAGAGGDSG